MIVKRCDWPTTDDPVMIEYHDREWGRPLHDDRKLFEFMVLDAFQAGLSWRTVLHKRKAFEKAFKNFQPAKVAKFTATDVNKLLDNASIIRNRQKIEAAIKNAQKFLEVQKEFGSFDKYIWQFVGGKPIKRTHTHWQATSAESDAMSIELKKRGFSFVGSTICYAFMQAAGLVDDHHKSCFRY